MLRFPRFSLAPGADGELCTFVRLRGTAPLDLVSSEVRNRSARNGLVVRHFLVYLYTGEQMAGFAGDTGRVVASRACLALGPPDRDHRQLITSGNSLRDQDVLPPGVALRLAPAPATPGGPPDGIGILLDANWVNPGRRQAFGSSVVLLRRARRGTVKRLAHPLFDNTAEMGLSVPAGALRSTEASTDALNHVCSGEPPVHDAWTPAADACVRYVSGHMHGHGRLFAVDLLGTDGSAQNPPGGPLNPFEPERRHLFATPDFTDPGTRPFDPPQLLRAGESLHYACWQDNGMNTGMRLGCQEEGSPTPGVALGLPGGGPAKPCMIAGPASAECPAEDTAYPGRSFTGACVPANLTAGLTPDDEVCALTGAYFDAIPGAPDETACDVTSLPPLY